MTYQKGDAIDEPRPGYLPILRAGNVTDYGLDLSDLIYVPASRISARQLVRRHDVVIAASSGSREVVGKAAPSLTEFTGGFGAFCKVLRPGPRVHPRYFAHFFQTRAYRTRIAELSAGANINNLRSSDLNDMRLPMPPLSEQGRIAEVLDRADALRAKRRAALDRLDELTQSIFLDMFGDPISNPNDLTKKPLNEVARIGTGSTPSRKDPSNFGGRVPWVKTSEVNKSLITSTEETLTTKGQKLAGCRLYPPGSVVIALYGQGKTRGRSAILGMWACTNQACAVIQPSNDLAPDFLLTQMQLGYHHLRSISRGGNQENLNLALVGSFEILVPPIECQRNFGGRMARVRRLTELGKNQYELVDELYASLQRRAFRGEL